MSKKTNTLLFILGATAFNILITIVCFLVLLVVFVRLVVPYVPDPESPIISWGFPIMFIGAIVLSFFLYRLILKQLMKKIDFEKHFDPIFGRRKK